AIRTQIIDARSNIASIRGQLPQLKGRLAREPLLIPADQTKDNPQRAQIEEKLRMLKVQRVELLNDFQPDSPEVQAVDQQIQSFTQQLKAEPETVTVKTQVPNPARTVLEPKVAELEAALVSNEENYKAALAAANREDRPVKDLSALQGQLDSMTHELERTE